MYRVRSQFRIQERVLSQVPHGRELIRRDSVQQLAKEIERIGCIDLEEIKLTPDYSGRPDEIEIRLECLVIPKQDLLKVMDLLKELKVRTKDDVATSLLLEIRGLLTNRTTNEDEKLRP